MKARFPEWRFSGALDLEINRATEHLDPADVPALASLLQLVGRRVTVARILEGEGLHLEIHRRRDVGSAGSI